MQLFPRVAWTWSVAALLAATPTPAQAFAQEINTWVAQDALNPQPSDALLFVGSSSIRRWETLTRDFAAYEVIQRGFGGSQFSNLNFWVNQIVLPYDPAAIVVFEGTNDVASGKSAATVFADYLTFVNLVHTGQSPTRPPIPILYIGITPTPARWNLWPIAAQTNAMIEAHAQADSSLHYIDVPTPFLATGSPPAASLFVPDGLHLSRTGYALFARVIRDAVNEVLPPNQTYTPDPASPSAGARLLFDFGPDNPADGTPTASPDRNGNHWNNWHSIGGGLSIVSGEHIGNLITTTGAPTGIDLIITSGFNVNGIRNGGLLTPGPGLLGELAIPTATQDFFFSVDYDAAGGFYLNGLNRDLAYDLRFFGSRNSGETRITQFEAKGACRSTSIQLQTSGSGSGHSVGYTGNDNTIAELTAVQPDRFGQIFVDMSRIAGSFAYLNAVEIQVVAQRGICDLGDACGTIPSGGGRLGSTPPRIGASWQVDAEGFEPGATGGIYLVLGAPAPRGFGPCTVHLDPRGTVPLTEGGFDDRGGQSFATRIPAAADLAGLQLTVQALAVTPASALQTSNALRLRITGAR